MPAARRDEASAGPLPERPGRTTLGILPPVVRLLRLTSLLLLAVLCAGPAAAAICAAGCAPGTSNAGMLDPAAGDDSCHEASSPDDIQLASVSEHDCHDHGTEAAAAAAVAPSRADVAFVIAQAATHGAAVPTPACAGTVPPSSASTRRACPPAHTLALRI
jgi:hypothetical protein